MMVMMGLAAKEEGADIGALYDQIQQGNEMMKQLLAITPKKG